MSPPRWTRAVWEDGRLVNAHEGPLWSGKGDPPPIGSEVVCNDKPRTRVTVTGYSVEGDWLMVEGYRTADPAKRGNLAGAEILWPEPPAPVDLPANDAADYLDRFPPEVREHVARAYEDGFADGYAAAKEEEIPDNA